VAVRRLALRCGEGWVGETINQSPTGSEGKSLPLQRSKGKWNRIFSIFTGKVYFYSKIFMDNW